MQKNPRHINTGEAVFLFPFFTVLCRPFTSLKPNPSLALPRDISLTLPQTREKDKKKKGIITRRLTDNGSPLSAHPFTFQGF